ncbi:MAG: transglycosylase SLT domain-containing protein [Thermodesulfobacteriota bacterium]
MGDLNKLWPMIGNAADRYGLDPDLVAAMVLTESAANPYAVRYEPHVDRYVQDPEKHRPRGCSTETERRLQMMSFGLMQVMGFNIRAMGYEGWLSEYLDPAKGLEVGCRFLVDLLRRWKSVEDAVSAYNQGSPRRGEDGRYRNQAYVDQVMTRYRRLAAKRRESET